MGLPLHHSTVYLISGCTGLGISDVGANLPEPLADCVPGGNLRNLPAFQMLFLCPRDPPHQSQVCSKNTLEKVHEGHQTLIISFQESIKIYLLTVFFQPVIFLNFRKMVEWLALGGWVRSHLQASQRRPNHRTWADWVVYRANRAACFQ